MYRLHLDVPLECSQEEAILITNTILKNLQHSDVLNVEGVNSYNIRLGCDSDRQKSNYLDINDNGHCSNKKLTIQI